MATSSTRHNPNVPDLPGPPEIRVTEPGQQSFVRPRASEPNPIPPPVALDIRGKIGQTYFAKIYPWINHYQRSKLKKLCRFQVVIAHDPKTQAQLENRARFAAAVRGWHSLTPAVKAAYNARGNRKPDRIEGLNVWIREFIAAHDLSEFQLEAELRRAQPDLPFSGPGP